MRNASLELPQNYSGGLRPPAIHRFPLRGKGCFINGYYHREAVAGE